MSGFCLAAGLASPQRRSASLNPTGADGYACLALASALEWSDSTAAARMAASSRVVRSEIYHDGRLAVKTRNANLWAQKASLAHVQSVRLALAVEARCSQACG